ncbi:hypothetical protein EKH77_02500 [Streptomyces luteoverticillatus]|uniref:Lipoprotein n=1 Tax=Streptomyces luteoverticillatus TaxID=66425 RepID=A0A3S9PSH9_STRLT|nr:hypothetical protein EKH77_02500 [Streptomyces luteoverticillatus]
MRRWTRRATGVALAGLVTFTGAGCSNGSSGPSGTGSKAASVASQASAAVSSLASEASGALASASAEARRKLDGIKGGVDVKGDVKLGNVTTDGEGHATARLTPTNTAGSAKSFAVQVNFTDPGGNLLDTAVVTVPDVPAGKTGTATARSTRKLSGDVRAEVVRAVRY